MALEWFTQVMLESRSWLSLLTYHTDLSPNNIMLGVAEPTVWSDIELTEKEHPSPRKVLGDRTVYQLHDMPRVQCSGRPVITDFGAARLGEPGQM